MDVDPDLRVKCENCGKRVVDGVARERWPFSTGYCTCSLSSPVLNAPPPNPPVLVISPELPLTVRTAAFVPQSEVQLTIKATQMEVEPVALVEAAVPTAPDTVVAAPTAVAQVAAVEANAPVIPDKFELVEKLGEGGMGSVFRVRDKQLNSVNAIKMMKPELMKDRAALKRFEKEAAAVGDLTHPNIVQVFGYDATEGATPYLMMEYVDGTSLAELLKHEKLVSEERAINICLQVCEALEHAHTKGVVHRDLTPSNILIVQNKDGSDTVKIVDFGIAKLAPVQGVTELTQQGDVLGSPKYMSPEQAKGEIVDQRSDVYSLGCVLYEMLAGRPLYVGANGIHILMHHLNTPITHAMTKLKERKISGNTMAIIAKMLSKQTVKRYQSATEVRRELARIKMRKLPVVVVRRRVMIAAWTAAILISMAYLISLAFAVAPFAAMPTPPNVQRLESIPQSSLPANDQSDSTWTVPRPSDNQPASWYNRVENASEQATKNDQMSQAEADYRREELHRIITDSTDALVAMGGRAVPASLGHIDASDRLVRLMAHAVLTQVGEPSVKPLMQVILGKSKDNADNASRLSDELSVLGAIGKPALDEALVWLDSNDSLRQQVGAYVVRWIAQRSIGLLAPDAPYSSRVITTAYLPRIVSALHKGKNECTRVILLDTMADLPGNSQIDDALTDTLSKSINPNERLHAARSLNAVAKRESSAQAEKSARVLAQALAHDSEPEVRTECANGLATIDAPAAIAGLRAGTNDIASVRHACIRGLCLKADRDRDCLPDLQAALHDKNDDIVGVALQTVAHMRKEELAHAPAVEDRVLELLAESDNSVLNIPAINALVNCDAQTRAKAVPIVVKLLENCQPYYRSGYISLLSVLGPAARVATPLLKKIAADTAHPSSKQAQQVLDQWSKN